MNTSSTAFLGVEASLTNRRWIGPDAEDDRRALAISQNTGIPEFICRILARRNVSPGEAAAYLRPSLRDLMPDPSGLKDMDKAASRLWQAVNLRQRIAIFADYDVDGGSSAALLVSWLRYFDLRATLYVPDRIEEGYGPNTPAMQMLGASHDLIICVDCGTLSHEPVEAAACDVVVVDHHMGGETLPPALAVVNPNRQDETTDLSYLCAAGVVFMLLVAVNRLMRAEKRQGPDLLGLLDLVALATVADVAPLIGLNRALVRQGLAVMGRGQRPGLAALAETGKLTGAPNAYALGFVMGPRVNAGGRVGAADLGARLLSTDDPHEAAAIAERLDKLNTERRSIESAVLAQAKKQASERGVEGSLVWAAGDGWHPGVVGIVAARLKEAFGKPAIVIGFEGDAGKGSGRSVNGIDLGAAVARMMHEELLEKGGGHKMAVGLSLTREQLEPAMQRLSVLMANAGAEAPPDRSLKITGLITPGAATPELADEITGAGPYGAGSPTPRVVLAGTRVLRSRPVGTSHLSLTLGDSMGGRLDAIAFRAFESDIGPALANGGPGTVHIAGRLERDDWGGRSKAKLFLEDAAIA